MKTIQVRIEGPEAESAANEIAAVLSGDGDQKGISYHALEQHQGQKKTLVDPLSIIAIILSIPPSIIAAGDLADRLHKRAKANSLIDVARRLRREKGITIELQGLAGQALPLDEMDADTILRVADEHSKTE